jgi:PKD repeat protein
MTATTAIDPSGGVQYYFDEISNNPGSTDSGWQTSSSYTDTGLACGTTYTYRVQTRDAIENTGSWSSSESPTTNVCVGDDNGEEDNPNLKPIADASAGEPYQGFINTEITFDGSKSSDSDGTIMKWFWDFGDNTSGTGKTVAHTFSQAGNYTITLTVTDDDGAAHTDTTTCKITQNNTTQPNRPPTKPIITGTITGSTNTQYSYTVVSTDPDNDIIQYAFDWGDSATLSSGFLPNGTSYIVNHSWTTPGQYTLTVTVTDNQTESSSSMIINIYAEEKNPSTPGFELVFALCTIVVAMFLWRKKRNV